MEMDSVVSFFLVGFVASLVDGCLGMGFGPTSSSIMLATGVNPRTSVAMVNLAKIAGGGASAVAHWRLGNIDRRLVARLAVPGCAGSLIGVAVLARFDADGIEPILHMLLIGMALRILWRFRTPPAGGGPGDDGPSGLDLRGAPALGLAGGVTNALIGAWGPVVTPYLLHRGLPARYAVGSVNTAEVAVAIVAAGSLFGSGGIDGIDAASAVAMLTGATVAAPLAALVVRRLPVRGLGVAVAAMRLFTSTRGIATWAGWGSGRWLVYAAIIVLVGLAVPGRRSRPDGSVPRRAQVVGPSLTD
ncbi:MAG: sulfite exporter TauE/SafE family protein [Acidimicrobiales bacterium]